MKKLEYLYEKIYLKKNTSMYVYIMLLARGEEWGCCHAYLP